MRADKNVTTQRTVFELSLIPPLFDLAHHPHRAAMLTTSPRALAYILLGSPLALARPHDFALTEQVPLGVPSQTEVTLAATGDDSWRQLASKYAPIIYLA